MEKRKGALVKALYTVLAMLHLFAGVYSLGVVYGVFYFIVVGALSATTLSYSLVQHGEDADGEHVIAHALFLVSVFTSASLLLDALF